MRETEKPGERERDKRKTENINREKHWGKTQTKEIPRNWGGGGFPEEKTLEDRRRGQKNSSNTGDRRRPYLFMS